MKQKVVITYGTFDLFHKGHIRLLKRIKKNNVYLIVGLSSDKFNLSKGKVAYDKYSIRKSNILKSGLVDKVIAEKTWVQKEKDIKKYKVDEFIMGDDWQGHFDHLKCKVTYLSRTPGISSTMLRNKKKK